MDYNKDIVFGQKWFERHQVKLLWLLNTPLIKVWFRYCLRIKDINERITEIYPNRFSFGDGEKIKTDFRTHDKFSKRMYFAFKPLWYILHFFDWVMLDRVEAMTKLSFGFSTLTVYPDAGTGGTTVDGRVYRNSVDEVWAIIRAGAGIGHSDTGAITTFFRAVASTTSNQWEALIRYIATLDTSSLTANSVIFEAVFSVVGTVKADGNSNTPDANVYGSTPASNNDLVNADYSQTGSTAYATAITYANLTSDSSTYTNFTFNATGIAAISKTGITKLAIRNANYDVANSAPSWASLTDLQWTGYHADQTGTSTDPKLVVTYTNRINTIGVANNKLRPRAFGPGLAR